MARTRQDRPAAPASSRAEPAARAAPAGRPGLQPDQVARLQRSAGNRAISTLVQRAPSGGHDNREPGPAPAVSRAAGPATRSIAEMTPTERLVAAYQQAPIEAAVRQKLESLISPEALVGALLGFAATFAVAQLTPVGWAADIAIAFTGIFVGAALYTAIKHLIAFAEARNASTPEQLAAAGQEFAAAMAGISVDALILLLTRGLGGGRSGGQPPAQSGGLVLASTPTGQLVPVAVETIPAAVAAELGLRAGAGVLVAMSSTGGPSQGHGEEGHSEEDRSAESQADAPTPEDYQAVDTARPPVGLTVIESTPRPMPDGTIRLVAQVKTPDGGSGTVQRSFDPATGKFIMEEAFLDQIPEQYQWIQVGSGRMRLQAWLTLRQMRRFGIGFGQAKQVKMSTIQNIRALVEYEVAMRQPGMTPDRAVAQTHSVKYARRTLAGAGVRVVKTELTGGQRGAIGTLCDHFERSNPALRPVNDKLLADNGLTRQSTLLRDYDIKLTVEPAGPQTSGGTPGPRR